jgi:uncharacterized protein (UPF0335 family)
MAPFSSIIDEPSAAAVDLLEGDVFDDSSRSLELTSCSTPIRHGSLRSSESSTRSNASVTFSDDVTVYPVLHVHDFTLEEKRDCWLNGEDLRSIRKEWKEVVEVMEIYDNNQMETNDNLCVRGLEGKTYVGKRLRQEARALSIDVVLNEQAYQSVPDPFLIAIAYSDQVFPLHMEAFERAQRDAQAVGNEVKKEEKPTRFDFRAVRDIFYATKRTDNNNKENGGDDATVSIYEDHSSANNKDLLKGPAGFNFRNKWNCLLPIAPKRHGRRTLVRQSKTARYI